MPILANDIKIVASRVMDDVPEGGGSPTANVILDGASNAIFPDISELDRAGGDVSFRKLFVHVQTDNTDTYLGSNIIIAEPPTDPNVSVTLFSTGATFDERDEASGRVESYLVSGPEWPGFLYENHVAGQRVVQIFQRETETPPDIGDTIILIYHEGLSDERLQYVRVIDVSTVVRTFTTSDARIFRAAVVSCDLSDPLRMDFPGSPASDYFTRIPAATKIRDSTVGDAAVYAGVSPTTAVIDIGDISASVESIFTQLVPSAQTEIPLVDQSPSGQSFALTESSDGTVSYVTSQPFNSTTTLSVGNGILPGSLVITIGGATLVDTGGQIFDGATAIGIIDYGRGTIAFPTLSAAYTGVKTLTFAPAAAPLRVADTAQIAVTPQTRAFNYIRTIVPAPAPGSVQVSYRAQGRWYDLYDNGSGTLRGSDGSYGVGSINYATGSIAVTLGALPDDGSSILFAWASRANYINRVDMAVENPSVRMHLPPLVEPGTLTIVWNDGTPRSAVDDGAGGISGSAIGRINYGTGLIEITPTFLPAGGQEYAVAFSIADPVSEKENVVTGPIREVDSTVVINLGETNITPSTVRMSWSIELAVANGSGYVANRYVPPSMSATDNGAGGIITADGRAAGTIDYATGEITFQPDGNVTGSYTSFNYGGGGAVIQPGVVNIPRAASVNYIPIPTVLPVAGAVTTKFQAGGTANSEDPLVFVTGDVKFDITNRYGEQIVPGSVNFLLGGRRYFDRLGALYNALDIVTGSAITAGTINYSTGEVTLTDWAPGASNLIDVDSLLTSTGDQAVAGVAFRVPVSPVRSGSLQILATKAEGGLLNVTAASDGTITGPGVRGSVDYETGVVSLDFGAMVTAAGNEGQPWYDPDDVVGGMIWHPAFVFAPTLRFNAVAYTYLPLDAAILGLDPVRLPQDGRVPIFRPGTFAVIGHTNVRAPATVTNGLTIALGRVRLSRVRVVGDDGLSIPNGYSTDLEAGTITFTNVTGYSQPVVIEDRVEDMVQVSDVQINGTLAFTRQISHAYPIGSFISSALISNDLKARVSKTFDQGSWDSTNWSDTLIGAAATGTYNTTNYPLVVTNRGAVTERWALRFNSSSSFQVIGESVGVIDVGTINAQCAPINPVTGTPYFTLPEGGWGTGWATGNILRINTVGALYPFWIVRTVQQGAESVQNDSFALVARGDVDRP